MSVCVCARACKACVPACNLWGSGSVRQPHGPENQALTLQVQPQPDPKPYSIAKFERAYIAPINHALLGVSIS